MIELKLPATDTIEVPFKPNMPVVKGNQKIPPLEKRVSVGVPLVLQLNGETVADDKELLEFIKRESEYKKQGKDHLCIIPHGPLHYFPFHLVGESGKPLADEWIVTYLPNISFLTASEPKTNRTRNTTSIAMGISFKQFDLFNQGVLPEAIPETKAISEVFSSQPLLEREATRERFISALESASHIHLSTHGTHSNAAAFQCLYLAPDKTSNGRFFAYELINLDLKGLEVITLSACETVLGRFDWNDNLRGLPAFLLRNGVQTLIGTLWKVHSNSAEEFFTVFYKNLLDGKARLDAFAEAQKHTRQKFPTYAAWGPFYYIGYWKK